MANAKPAYAKAADPSPVPCTEVISNADQSELAPSATAENNAMAASSQSTGRRTGAVRGFSTGAACAGREPGTAAMTIPSTTSAASAATVRCTPGDQPWDAANPAPTDPASAPKLKPACR